MHPRVDVTKYLGLGVGRAMLALWRETEELMEPRLYELVKIRASQLNGCAYCIDMHTKDARLAGESEQRIYVSARRARRRPSTRASALRSNGPNRSRGSARRTFPTRSMRASRHCSTRTSWWR
jgi:AhpD family alkylhydroperoxidase